MNYEEWQQCCRDRDYEPMAKSENDDYLDGYHNARWGEWNPTFALRPFYLMGYEDGYGDNNVEV